MLTLKYIFLVKDTATQAVVLASMTFAAELKLVSCTDNAFYYSSLITWEN